MDSIIIGDGRCTIGGISIAGKGCVGLVFHAKKNAKSIALKVRRTDADRPSMDREADHQQIANRAGVGPAYLAHTKNVLAMEYLEGKSIADWTIGATESEFCRVARSVLDQCRALDMAGLDHGELSRISRHVLVSAGGQPRIIDFESSSTTRRTSNVTSAAQSLFLYGSVARQARTSSLHANNDSVVKALRNYKTATSQESYHSVLEALGIAF